MKILIAILMFALASGCATFRTRPLSFQQAVRASLFQAEGQTFALVSVQKDGSLLVGARPTTHAELESLLAVDVLPDPPALMVEGHPEANHADVRAVLDVCTKIGLWRVNFRAMEVETQNKMPRHVP